jgi:hypothetical protein
MILSSSMRPIPDEHLSLKGIIPQNQGLLPRRSGSWHPRTEVLTGCQDGTAIVGSGCNYDRPFTVGKADVGALPDRAPALRTSLSFPLPLHLPEGSRSRSCSCGGKYGAMSIAPKLPCSTKAYRRQRPLLILDMVSITENKVAVVTPNRTTPLSASMAPIICHLDSRYTLAWPYVVIALRE